MSQFKEFKKNHFRPGLFLFSIILSTVMLIAAKWQWTRYHEKLTLVETFRNHSAENPLELSANELEGANLDDLLNKRISIKGKFDFGNQVMVGNRRSKHGAGSWLLTPFKLSGSQKSILVSRGFIPFEDRDEKSWLKYTPKNLQDKEVQIQGVLYKSTEKRSAFSPEASTNDPKIYLYPNINLISKVIPQDIFKGLLVQGIMPPVTGDFPMTDIKIDVPPSTHFWYTFEWIILAILTQIIVFLIQLFRPLRKQASSIK